MLLGEVVEHPVELIALVQAIVRHSVAESTLSHVEPHTYIEERLLLIIKARDAHLISPLAKHRCY